ncbi:MAG: hypothetical protein WD555_00765 [Fulvivirga sp.]
MKNYNVDLKVQMGLKNRSKNIAAEYYQIEETSIFILMLTILAAPGLVIIVILSLAIRRLQQIYPLTLIIMLFFCISSWPFIQNMNQDNPYYRDLRAVRNIQEIKTRPLFATINLNPIKYEPET